MGDWTLGKVFIVVAVGGLAAAIVVWGGIYIFLGKDVFTFLVWRAG